jgi:hypothetical protein
MEPSPPVSAPPAPPPAAPPPAAPAAPPAATTVGEPGSVDRQMLEVEAQGQHALARVMNQFFLGSFPALDADGLATCWAR